MKKRNISLDLIGMVPSNPRYKRNDFIATGDMTFRQLSENKDKAKRFSKQELKRRRLEDNEGVDKLKRI